MRTLSIAFLSFLLLLVPTVRAVETLPSRLSDAAFWRLVTESSEPDGKFISENFLSNERGFQYVIPSLLQTVEPGGVYMGVGPEQNFTYIAAFHPKMAIIVDIRRQNMIEHLLYKAVFEMATNRAEFLSLLFSRKLPPGLTGDSTAEDLFKAFASAPADPQLHQKNLLAVEDLLRKQHKFELTADDEASLVHVYDEIAKAGTQLGYTLNDPSLMAQLVLSTRIRDLASVFSGDTIVPASDGNSATPNSADPVMRFPNALPSYTDLMTATDGTGTNWSYLASEKNYKAVREMQQSNLVVPVVGDFAGPKAIRAVGQYLKDHNATVSVFYLSNVEEYLTPTAMLMRFYGNVGTLPLNASSSFIRSAQATGTQPGIVQSLSSPILDVLGAVLDGRARSSRDILSMSH